MNDQHTRGRLRLSADENDLEDENGCGVCALYADERAPVNAARLAAAWNACEGLTLEQIERLGVALHNEGVITETLKRVLNTTAPGCAEKEANDA